MSDDLSAAKRVLRRLSPEAFLSALDEEERLSLLTPLLRAFRTPFDLRKVFSNSLGPTTDWAAFTLKAGQSTDLALDDVGIEVQNGTGDPKHVVVFVLPIPAPVRPEPLPELPRLCQCGCSCRERLTAEDEESDHERCGGCRGDHADPLENEPDDGSWDGDDAEDDA